MVKGVYNTVTEEGVPYLSGRGRYNTLKVEGVQYLNG